MAIALVQSVQKIVNGVNNTTLAYGSNVAAGNLLCVTHVHYESSPSAISTPTDTLTHTYAPMTAEQGTGNIRTRSYSKENCSGGANTVTFDIAGAGTGSLSCVIAEFSGEATAAALDKTQVGTGTGTAVDSGATATTAQADEMVWGACCHDGSNIAITETGSATLVQEFQDGDTGMPIACSYRIVAAAAAYSATWTLGAGPAWFAHVATFKAAGGGGGARTVARGVQLHQAVNRASTY